MIKNWILGGLAALALCGAARAQDVQPAPGCLVGVPCFAKSMTINGATLAGNSFALTGTALFNNTIFIAAGSVRVASDAGQFSIGGSNDVVLNRDAANALALRNGLNPQGFNVYNTYTDGSNYEGSYVKWSGNVFRVGSFALGTGLQRSLSLETQGTSRWQIDTGGNFIPASSGAYNIGTNGTQLVNNVFSTNLWAGGSGAIGFASQARMTSPGDGVLLTAKNAGGQLTVATLPTCTAGLDGSRAFVTDASATTFASSVVAGGTNHIPVYCDGSGTPAWKIG